VRNALRVATVVVVLVVASGSSPPEGGWLGQRVVLKQNCVPRDKRPGGNDERPSAELGGDRVNAFLIYRVDQVDGRWLKLVAGSSGRAGWVADAQVVLFDRSIDYFTSLIHAEPRGTWAYLGRGFVWSQKDEYDKAITDFNQVLLLNPDDPGAYLSRGEAWYYKDEYDKAIG
jgi:tetratricopeptide (TPR) repeat protein